MTGRLPDDDDGDAIRAVAAAGGDLTRPMLVEITVVVPDRRAADGAANAAKARGYDAEIDAPEDDDEDWEVVCAKSMVLTYDAIVHAQRELDEIAASFGGATDGWGTFGNA